VARGAEKEKNKIIWVRIWTGLMRATVT